MDVEEDPVLGENMKALEPCAGHLWVLQSAHDLACLFKSNIYGAVIETAGVVIQKCRESLSAAEKVLTDADPDLEATTVDVTAVRVRGGVGEM
jgi:hypothetical protein